MAKKKAMNNGILTGKRITGKHILYTILTLKSEYGKDVKGLESDSEYIRLQSIVRLNATQTFEYDGIKYAVGGIDSGRKNPAKGLKTLVLSVKGLLRTAKGKVKKAPNGWASLSFRTPEEATECPVCGNPVGLDVDYTKEDGEDGIALSLSLSHGIPSIFFGCTNDSNVTVECRRCNGQRGDRMEKAVRKWYEKLKFDVYDILASEDDTDEDEDEDGE